jgi:hypothetical protein
MSAGAGFISRNYRPAICAIVIMAWLGSPESSFAYLDPGAGSFAFQFLIAAGMAALFAIKMFWARIKAFFRGEKDVTSEPPSRPTTDAALSVSEPKSDSPASLTGPDKEES